MKNKTILALAIASTLGLTACGDETTGLRIDDTISDSLNRQSSIAFDLLSATKTVSIPTYLSMDTSDGTLNIPLKKGDDPTDHSNPAVAMGDTDGWSPTQPFVIKLGLPTGVTLTTDASLLDAAVKIAKIDVSSTKVFSIGDPLADVLIVNEHYQVYSDGTSLTVLPINGSLEHSSDYIYAITDSLVDSSGEKLGMSSNYASLKNKQIDQTGTAFEVPQKIVWQAEALMDDYGIADDENIIYSSWFTTSSAGNALYATKIAAARVLAAGGNGTDVWPGDANPNHQNLEGLYAFSNIELVNADNSSPTLAYLAGKVAATLSVHTGTIKLPSFLERDLTKWDNTPWQSAMPSLAIISGILKSGTDEEKVDLETKLFQGHPSIDANKLEDSAEQLKLIGQSFTKLDNTTELDPERLITKYSPFPKVKDIENVKFLLITPKTATSRKKVPVVIYQHGITSVKENILASGDALINGYAILAIDLPLHGERRILDDKGTSNTADDIYHVADADHADVFLNFGFLTVGRDNMRQAVADLIGLRAGLSLTGGATPFDVIDTDDVSFFGHSLGSMTGISLQATIDKPLLGQLAAQESSFAIDKAVFSNPGGGVPYLLLNSVGFGGTVKHGLMDASSADYKKYASDACSELSNTDCFNNFYDGAAATSGAQATIDATFQSFAVAAQTVLETVDPFSLARQIPTTTPVYLAQVKNDMVIPNILAKHAGYAAPYSPIGGTTPLIAQLGLTNIATDNSSSKKVALLNAGEHSSAIMNDRDNSFASAEITAELQSQIVSFLAGDGTTLAIGNNALLD